MDKAIVERAVQALAAMNGPRREEADPFPLRESTTQSVSRPEVKGLQETATCGSPNCAGCYEVGDERKIHPPKIGKDYQKWLERWKARGSVQ